MPPRLALPAQLLVAGLGGLVFHALGLPAAWLSGAVVAVALWGALGFKASMPLSLVDAAMLVSGISLGAGVTPEGLAAMARYPLSLAILLVALVAIPAAASLWLMRVSGWSRDDAVLATVPGALSTVFAIALDRGAALAPIAVVQSVRFLVLVALLPSAVAFAGDAAAALPGDGATMSPLGFGAILVAGWLLGLLFERIGIMAPILLGGTVASGILHATEMAPGPVPADLTMATFALIGAYVAERFHTLDARMLARTLPAALASFAVGMGTATLFAALASAVSGVRFSAALVAFSPGGLEAMLVLSLALNLDPLYVGAHHLARVLALGFGLPLVMTLLPKSAPSVPVRGERTP